MVIGQQVMILARQGVRMEAAELKSVTHIVMVIMDVCSYFISY